MLLSNVSWVGMVGRSPNTTPTRGRTIETEAGLNSQAGLALFFSHTKYLRRYKGFPYGDVWRMRWGRGEVWIFGNVPQELRGAGFSSCNVRGRQECVSRLRRSSSSCGYPVLPGWLTFSGRPSGPGGNGKSSWGFLRKRNCRRRVRSKRFCCSCWFGWRAAPARGRCGERACP